MRTTFIDVLEENLDTHPQTGRIGMHWNAFSPEFKSLTFSEKSLLSFLMLPAHLLLDVDGLEHFRSCPRPFIVACNHNNALESLLVPATLVFLQQGEKISFVTDWMFGKVPFLGPLIELNDPVYVYGKRSTWRRLEMKRPPVSPYSVIEECSRMLCEGRSIGIFPEGTRNPDPERLLKGRAGIGHMALQNGVSVLPVGIDYSLRQRKGRIPVIGKTLLRIGAPMHFPERTEQYRVARAAKAPGNPPQSAALAAGTTHDIMFELARLCGKSYDFPSPSTDTLESTNVNTQEGLCPV